MWRLAYRLFRLVSGAQFWFERRLSRAGLFVAAGAVFAAAFGADTHQTLAYQLFALLAALGLVAVAASRFVRIPVAVERRLPRTLAAGEAFSYTVRLRNLSAAPLGDLVVQDTLADPRPRFEEFRRRLRLPTYRGFARLTRTLRVGQVFEPAPVGLPRHGECEVRVTGRTYRRGVLRFESAAVARPDPLGLFRARRAVAMPANVVVLPRRYPVPPITLGGTRRYQPGGVSNAASVGESEEFVSLREYRPGDPLQRIHWKSFARVGEPVVREFQDEFFERHALVLDTFGGPAAEPQFEEAVSVAASFAYTLDTRDCLLDLVFVGERAFAYTGGRGQMQPVALLEVLAGARLAGERPFTALRDAVIGRRATLSGCILVLIAWDEARRALVRELQALGLPTLVLAVLADPVPEVPAGVRVLRPGRIAEGLARL